MKSISGAVISVSNKNNKTYIKLVRNLGTRAYLKTVPLEGATIFTDPADIEFVLHEFDVPQMKIEEVMISTNGVIERESDKYALLAKLATQIEMQKKSVICDNDSDQGNQIRVMFRKAVSSPQAGDVIAVFVDHVFDNNGMITTYMFVGQHSGASPSYILEDTVSTKSGCDTHGCMKKHLEEVVGYENLVEVDDLELLGRKPKCLYCDTGEEPNHYICESCGDGMCESCYSAGVEHDAHYQDPSESAEDEESALILEDVFSNGYGCEDCVGKAIRMHKNIQEEENGV